MSELALKLIAEEKKNKTGKLEIGNCGLTELPEELFELIWLEELNVCDEYFDNEIKKYIESENEGLPNKLSITSLPKGITKLQKLKVLRIEGQINSRYKINDITPIKELKQLTLIDFSTNQISDLSPIKELKQLTNIDFSTNQISDLSPIKELKQLTLIDFSTNQISDLSPIKELKQLTTINFRRNQISDLSPIKELKQLTNIDFSDTQISDLSPIKELKQLTHLYFGSNQISDISPIKELKQLTHIRFVGNQISDISPIKELKQLTFVNFCKNQISELSPIKELHNVNYLHLLNNLISDLSPIKELNKLNYIHFGQNNISDLSPIKGLNKLRKILFYDNQISDLSPIKELKQLKYINFESNQISDLSPIKELKQLKNIYFEVNQISEITQLGFILKLKAPYIRISGNPFIEKNAIVLPEDTNHYDAIKLALERIKEAKEKGAVDGYLPVRILLLGNTNSGKSSLVHYLKSKYGNLHYNGTSTHILKIEPYKNQEKNDLPIGYFYDFGGQDFYHGLYQAFLSHNALALILWCYKTNKNQSAKDCNKREIRNYDVYYWLGQWKRSIGGNLLLIQTHKDEKDSKRKSYLSDEYPIEEEFYLSLDSEKFQKIANPQKSSALAYLKSTIDFYIKENQKQQDSQKDEKAHGKISKKYYDFIMKLKNKSIELQANPISSSGLRDLYENVKDDRFENELKQLELSGMVLRYEDTVWLNPQAVVENIHNIFSSELIGNGIVSKVDFNAIINDDALKNLLIKHKVIFEHKYGDNDTEYIVPNYLPLIKSSGIDYDLMVFGLDNSLFVLKYKDFMPFGLINQMICYFGKLPDSKKFWRDQLIFTVSQKEQELKCKILIKLNYDALKIEVFAYFDPNKSNPKFREDIKEYLFYILSNMYHSISNLPDDFDEYQKIKNISFSKEPQSNTIRVSNYVHPIHKNEIVEKYKPSETAEPKEEYFEWRDDTTYISLDNKNYVNFIELLENGIKPLIKTYNEDFAFKGIKPANIYQCFTHNKFEKMKKIFISYSRKDVEYKNELRNHLNLAKTLNIFDNWSCEDITIGKWDEQIQKELEESDLIIFMLSANFFNSRYIIEKEVLKGMKLVEENKNKQILCVIVSDFIGLHKLNDPTKTKSDLEEAILNLNNYQYLPYDSVLNPKTSNKEEKIVSLEEFARQGRLNTALTQIVEKILEFIRKII